MECPKCGFVQDETNQECHRCGVAFGLWEARRKRGAGDAGGAAAPEIQDHDPSGQPKAKRIVMVDDRPRKPDPAGVRATAEAWLRRGLRLAALFLVLGFCWPLFKHTLLHGRSIAVWPWHLMAPGDDPVLLAAIATVSAGDHLAFWALWPLLGGVAAWSLATFTRSAVRAYASLIAGVAFLIVFMAFLFAESEILGIIFVPPTPDGGLIAFTTILAAATVAATNHTRKAYATPGLPRILGGVAGVVLAILTGFAMGAAPGAWKAWSMWILYLTLMALAIQGFRCALARTPGEGLQLSISRLARFGFVWVPVAIIVAQSQTRDAYVTYVVGGGGDTGNLLAGGVKGFLILGGGSLLMAYGLGASLTCFLAGRSARATMRRPISASPAGPSSDRARKTGSML